jgi:CRISPR system Cascade subunit CasE
MYLSQLQLNYRHKQVRTDLASPYQLHATLCRAFADEDQTPPRFLWRLEENQTPIVLVQSADSANWEKLEQRYSGYFRETPKAGSLLLDHLQHSQILRFRLKANPTITTRDKNNPTGDKKKRYGLYKLEDLVGEEKEGVWHPGWLERQAKKETSGFTLMGFTVAQNERIKTYKHKEGNPITLQSVLFEGHLKITDVPKFKHTLAQGIGHAKALGFGLLSIAKG